MDRNICIVVLMGLPGSGKSTLSSLISKKMCTDYSVIVVEYDQMISLNEQAQLAASAESDTKEWKFRRTQIKDKVRYFLHSLFCKSDLEYYEFCESIKVEVNNLKTNIVVIVDDNMFYRSMRYEYFKVAREFLIGFCVVYIRTPFLVCEDRNRKRQNVVPSDVILRMHEKLEPPLSESYLWESYNITVESDNVSAVEELIQKSILTPVPPLVDNALERDASRAICSTNVVHRLDGVWRKCVSNVVSKACDEKCKVATAANQCRRRLLFSVRNGIIGIGSDLLCDLVPDNQEALARLEQFGEQLFTSAMQGAAWK